jgi:hypothetical protein
MAARSRAALELAGATLSHSSRTAATTEPARRRGAQATGKFESAPQSVSISRRMPEAMGSVPWVTFAPQSPRAPFSRARIPDLLLSKAPRAAGCAACRQGTRADCGANCESSDPSGRGWRPSQRSQASPRPPAPRALGCESAISWRCRRHAMTSNVTASPRSGVSSHWILRNCGCGFIGSSQPGTPFGVPSVPPIWSAEAGPTQCPSSVKRVGTPGFSPAVECKNLTFDSTPGGSCLRGSTGRVVSNCQSGDAQQVGCNSSLRGPPLTLRHEPAAGRTDAGDPVRPERHSRIQVDGTTSRSALGVFDRAGSTRLRSNRSTCIIRRAF